MKGGGQQQNPPNQSLDLFLIIGFIFVTVILLWYYYSPQIVSAVFKFRVLEAKALLWFLEILDDMSELIDSDMEAIAQLEYSIRYMETTPAASVTYKDFYMVSNRFGEAFSLPAVLIGIIGVVYSLFFHRFSKFKQVYSMTSLSRQEVKNWPQISCVLGKNLINVDVREGEWRMSEQPLSFAKKHGLLKTEVVNNKTIARLDKEKAHAVFCSQMGPLWTGLEGLPPYVLALFAIFCAKAENDSEGARSLLRQIAQSASSGTLDYKRQHVPFLYLTARLFYYLQPLSLATHAALQSSKAAHSFSIRLLSHQH